MHARECALSSRQHDTVCCLRYCGPADQEVMIVNIFQLYRLISFITTHWCVQLHWAVLLINIIKREDDSSSKTTIQRPPYKITCRLFTTQCFLNGKCCVATVTLVFHITCLVHFPYDNTLFYSFAKNQVTTSIEYIGINSVLLSKLS